MTAHTCVSAIVLAGGRASRLGGISKPQLRLPTGQTLAERTVQCIHQAFPAAQIALVGPADSLPDTSAAVVVVREDPAFAGPAAAIAAGLDALQAHSPAEVTLILPVDLPMLRADTLQLLVQQHRTTEADAVLGRTADGRVQFLLAAVSTRFLEKSLAEAGSLVNAPVKAAFRDAGIGYLEVDDSQAADLDTPDDLHRLGIRLPD